MHSNNLPARIALFDSGIGGLTVLSAIQKVWGNADYFYCFDDAFFPYGQKPIELLKSRVQDVMQSFLKQVNPDILIIACNTVSTFALPMLRQIYPSLHIVGVVPPIKPACALSKTKKSAILATEQTVQRDYLDGLITTYAGNCQVYKWGSKNLVTLAEEKFYQNKSVKAAVQKEMKRFFTDPFVDTVALGCTHFPHLLAELTELYPSVQWIDPSQGVARRVKEVLQEKAIFASQEIKTTVFHTDASKNISAPGWGDFHVTNIENL